MTAEGLSHPELWARIRAVRLPTTRDGRDFATTLAHQNDIPAFEAREIEEEYRRFLYLAATSDAVRVPPVALRLAWRLHAHHPDYDRFCADTLGRPLPLDDASRRLGATGAYRDTRAAYAREFGATPTPMIWPAAIKPRLPRWLWAHAAILGVAAYAAWTSGDPMQFAIGLFLSLGLYGGDLYGAFRAQKPNSLGDVLSDDLNHFLKVGR